MTRGYRTIRRYSLVFLVLGLGMALYTLWTTYTPVEEVGVNAFSSTKEVSVIGPFEMRREFSITKQKVGESHYPVIAWTGSRYFVAWQTNVRGEFDIDGRFLSLDGKPMGTAAFPVASSSGDQYFAAVAWGKSVGLVVWVDNREVDSGIYAARVTEDGKVLDPEGIPVSTGAELRQYPRVAWDGRQFLVSWEEERPLPNQMDVFGIRLSETGKILDEKPLAIAANPGDQFWSSVASNGSIFLVVWTDQRDPASDQYDIYGARVDASGKILDPKGSIPISRSTQSQEYPSVSWDGSQFWVVWSDHRLKDSVAIYGSRVSVDGAVRDPDGIRLSREMGRRAFPSMVPLVSNRNLVMWEEDTANGRDLFGSLVDEKGQASFVNEIPIAVHPGMKHPLRGARVKDRILVVWQDKRSNVANLYGKVIRDKNE